MKNLRKLSRLFSINANINYKKDYYNTLGVTNKANPNQIKTAFYKLAKQCHPDKVKGKQEKFKQINQAYTVLSDQKMKSQYDMYRNNPNPYDQYYQSNNKKQYKQSQSFNMYNQNLNQQIFRVFNQINKMHKKAQKKQTYNNYGGKKTYYKYQYYSYEQPFQKKRNKLYDDYETETLKKNFYKTMNQYKKNQQKKLNQETKKYQFFNNQKKLDLMNLITSKGAQAFDMFKNMIKNYLNK